MEATRYDILILDMQSCMENDRMFSFVAVVIEIWSREVLEEHCLVACQLVLLQVLVTNQVVHWPQFMTIR